MLDYLEQRTGLRSWLRRLAERPVATDARVTRTLGAALLANFLLLGVTGALLSTVYTPSATTAWASVFHIHYQLTWGWIIRGLHHWGSQVFIVLVAVHVAHGLAVRAYARPREMNWILGIAILPVALGFAITGTLLPWDEHGYWGARTETSIAGTAPVVGPMTERLLVGGREFGHQTLARWHALHVVVLPAIFALLCYAHVAVAKKRSAGDIRVSSLEEKPRGAPYYPGQMLTDMLAALGVVLVALGLTVVMKGAPLSGPANPSGDFPARPMWYFAPLSKALGWFKGPMQPVGAALPMIVVAWIAAIPFVDRSTRPKVWLRGILLAPVLAVAVAGGLLIHKGMRDDAADADYQKAHARATARTKRSLVLASRGVPPEGPLAMMRSDPETRGAELYAEHCKSCHQLHEVGPRPGEQSAPDLSGFGTKAWAHRVMVEPDHDALFGKTPFKGSMPSMVTPPADPAAAEYFTAMKDEELELVSAFLAAQAEGDTSPNAAAEKVIKLKCTSCHRLDGKTDDDSSLAPELRGWGSAPWIEAQITDPSSGVAYPKGALDPAKEGLMPAFRDKISEPERRMLAEWLHEQAREP